MCGQVARALCAAGVWPFSSLLPVPVLSVKLTLIALCSYRRNELLVPAEERKCSLKW